MDKMHNLRYYLERAQSPQSEPPQPPRAFEVRAAAERGRGCSTQCDVTPTLLSGGPSFYFRACGDFTPSFYRLTVWNDVWIPSLVKSVILRATGPRMRRGKTEMKWRPRDSGNGPQSSGGSAVSAKPSATSSEFCVFLRLMSVLLRQVGDLWQ